MSCNEPKKDLVKMAPNFNLSQSRISEVIEVFEELSCISLDSKFSYLIYFSKMTFRNHFAYTGERKFGKFSKIIFSKKRPKITSSLITINKLNFH